LQDVKDDVDPIYYMHTHHGAMPDDGNDALFAVADLGFVVEAHAEGMVLDVAAKEDPPSQQKKRKRCLILSHMMLSGGK
jgi:hypothetical protein